MSRSGYSTDHGDTWSYVCWRGQVASATRGKRGQKLLHELRDAMDAMPEKKLIKEELKSADGGFCALGVVGQKRGLNLDLIDPEQYDKVSEHFDIAQQLAREIVYLNDEVCAYRTPEQRWQFMREWVEEEINWRTKND